MWILQIKRSLFSVVCWKGQPSDSLLMKYYNHWAKLWDPDQKYKHSRLTSEYLFLSPLTKPYIHSLKQPWKTTNSDRDLFCHFMHQSKTYSHFYSLPKKYKFCWNLFFHRCKVKHNSLIRLSGVLGIFVALDIGQYMLCHQENSSQF